MNLKALVPAKTLAKYDLCTLKHRGVLAARQAIPAKIPTFKTGKNVYIGQATHKKKHQKTLWQNTDWWVGGVVSGDCTTIKVIATF